MSIRKQSIISSVLVYIGFAVGLFNTWLFARGFAESQYGLTGTFVAIASVMLSFSNLGMLYYIYKFFPYYNDNVPPDKNDMMTIALMVSLTGFIFLLLAGFAFKDFVIQKYATNSPEVVVYYYWLFPFGFGLSLYSLLEAFAWQLKKSVLTNFLKEIFFRLLTTILIVLIFFRVIKTFDLFIKLYAFTYIIIAAILLTYLIVTKKLHFTFTLSRVTKKFYKKIVVLGLYVWGGSLLYNVSLVFDTLVIGAVVKNGMTSVGIYTLAQNISSLIQAPQRALISAAIQPLSQAWKDKDHANINRIYQRSSINQLIFAVGMFVLIWINFTDGVYTFHLKPGYLYARDVFLFIGLMRIIDLGTGLNAQVIGTSNYWRFDFITGVALMVLTLPLNYWFTKQWGVTGPAIANLIAMTIYNGIRYTFLLRKFNMQPFSLKSLYSVLLGVAGLIVCYLLFRNYQGLGWIILRSMVFMLIYGTGVLYLNLSPDIMPIWQTLKKKLGFKS